MIAGKLQVEVDSDCSNASETMSTTTESCFDNQGGRKREKAQVEKKMKKLRSIKLSRIPSTRKGRSTSSQFRTKLTGYAASSEQSTPIETSDASLNHINATNLENFQVLSTTKLGFKILRSATRKSRMKFRRPQTKKKTSRREVNSQDMNKDHLEASLCYSGSSFDRSDQDKNISANEKQQLAYPGNKYVRVVRASTLGPRKILTKMASLKSKRTKKCFEISSIPGLNVERDTCSSTLKSSMFPNQLENEPRGNESNGTAALNVCRYSYCSLQGHCHGAKPPLLKRFVSMRRRAAKSHKSLKPDPKYSGKPKHSGNRNKGVQAEKRVLNGNLGDADQQTIVDIREVPFVLGMEGSDFVSLAESVPGESSYPSLEERQSPETFEVFKDICVDCSGITEQQKAICNTSIKIEETERFNNGDRKSIQALDHLKGGDVSSKEFGDPTQFDNLSCNASVPLAEESHGDIDEDTTSSSNSEEYESQSGNSVKTVETISARVSCEILNGLFLSAPITEMMEEQTSTIEDKNEDSDLDSGILQPADPMDATSSMDVASKKKMENQKNFTFWKLIYRKMATSLDDEPETQTPRLGMTSEEEQPEDLLYAHENNDSCQEFSRADQATKIKDHEASNQKLEFSQSDAIKMVQQAFDNILSEIPDNPSNDQSIVSKKTSDQEFLLKKQDEGNEVSISTSSNSIDDCTIKDREEMKLETDKEIVSEEVKASQKEGKRSAKQMPSSWSFMKKIIILKRFVKSLEKLRNLKPKTNRYLHPTKDQEAENIQLRPQTEKGKKNDKEWMLDVALRQVISTLAPSQKRKVAMLVHAFETVIPTENGDDMRSNITTSSPTTSVEAYNEFSIDNGDGTENKIGFQISTVDHDQSNECNIAYQQLKRPTLDSKETNLLCSCKENTSCIANSKMSGANMKKEDTGTKVMEEQTSAIEDKNEGSDLDSGILQPADPMANTSSTDVASKKEKENQKNFTFCKLIYRKMATGLDDEPETQTLRPGMTSEEQPEDLLYAHEKNDSCQEFSRADHATKIKDNEASNRNLEFSQSDAIKLVQQAFDKILSEIPDNSSDDQSIVSEKTSDQEFLLKKQDDGKEVSISTSSNSIEDCTVQDQEEMKLETDKEIVSNEVKESRKEGKRSAKQMPSNWSFLKKIIILKRFVKSLEKLRNLKPKTNRYLPPTKDQEAGNIQLRPQTDKGNENAKEWMLDVALRQVISTLAPSQKRKVAMLVQAFETVIPAENGDDMRSNITASSPITSVEAYNEFSIENGDGTENKIGFQISLGKPLYSKMDSIVDHDQSSECNIVYQQLKRPALDSNETNLLRICKENILCTSGSEMSGTNMKKEDTSIEVTEEQTSAIEDKNEGSDLDSGILQPADPMEDTSRLDVTSKKEMENQKNFTFWKIIYRKMATGLDDEPETQTPHSGMTSEEQPEDLLYAHERNDSCQEFSRADQATKIKDHEASNRKLEFSQNDAIKLVQQAFDKILSEIPDNSSDDQSIISEKNSDQEFLLKKQDEGKEVSISTSSNSNEDCTVKDREEMKLETDKEIVSEEVKVAQKEGKRSAKQMPNNWSFLKKIIILKRFVKSLEKMRNLKPKTICYLPPTNYQEVENIQLRPQIEKGKKNVKEWMLDVALRQVISTMVPSQKRKVAMLVQAFETVIPIENGDDMRSNVTASSPTTSVQAYNEFVVDNGASAKNQIGSEISPSKLLGTACSEISGTNMKKEDTCAIDDNNVNDISIVDHYLLELEEPRQADKPLTDEDAIRTSHDKTFPVNEDVIQRISKEETSAHSSELCNAGSEIGLKKIELESVDSTDSSDQQSDRLESSLEVGEGTQAKYKFLRPPLGQPESNFTAHISKSERKKYTRLWYLIYKHTVSDSATKNESQPLADEEVQSDDANQHPTENIAYGQGSFEADHNNEIIKLVEEAIDEIPLPQIHDDTSDHQSVIGDVILDKELPEKKRGREEVKIPSSTLDSKEKTSNSGIVDIKMEAEAGIEEGNKSKKRVQKNWSNLKKLVLLRRFVKALEKVKEFNPRGPRFLPVDPVPESEKVLQRQQNMGDKKNASEWMLDYALQQVVAKLTPERKRRVGLLVEAFETVIPTIS